MFKDEPNNFKVASDNLNGLTRFLITVFEEDAIIYWK